MAAALALAALSRGYLPITAFDPTFCATPENPDRSPPPESPERKRWDTRSNRIPFTTTTDAARPTGVPGLATGAQATGHREGVKRPHSSLGYRTPAGFAAACGEAPCS